MSSPGRVIPTLIAFCGPKGGDPIVQRFQRQVEHRVGQFHSAVHALRWLVIEEDTSVAHFDELIGELLSTVLWRQLNKLLGYERGHSEAQVRLLFIVEEGEGDQTGLERLRQIASDIRGKHNVQLTLIYLGSGVDVVIEDLQDFWPRIRLDSVAKGLRYPRSYIWESVQHIVVSMILLPDVGNKLHQMRGDDVLWLVMGASAILADRTTMRRWLQAKVMYRLVGSFLPELSEYEQESIERATAKHVDNLWQKMCNEVEKHVRDREQALKEVLGPYVQLYDETPRSWGGAVVAEMRALWAAYTPSEQELSEKLKTRYVAVVRSLENDLAEVVGAKIKDIEMHFLGAFLDRNLYDAARFDKQPFPVQKGGMVAALVALQSLRWRLALKGKELSDAQWVPVDTSTYAWESISKEDARKVTRWLTSYHSFAKTIDALAGSLLDLFPAWLLGVYVVHILSRFRWGWGESIAASTLALLIIVLVEQWYWWKVRGYEKLRAIVGRIHQMIDERYMLFTLRLQRDFYWFVLAHLERIGDAMASFFLALTRVREEQKKKMVDLETHFSMTSGEQDSTYILGWSPEEVEAEVGEVIQRIEETSEWLKMPQEQGVAGEFENAVSALLAAEVLPWSKGGNFPQEHIEQRVSGEIAQRLKEYRADILAENHLSLKDGKRWIWLSDHAMPLGDVLAEEEMTIVVLRKESLSGPTAQGSDYWQAEWQVVSTSDKDVLSVDAIIGEMCLKGIPQRRRH